jgi:hypothetical protein
VRTAPLDIEFRRNAECFYSADFSDVRMHWETAVHATSIGIRAASYGSRDVLLFGRCDYDDPLVRSVLIHELCHVAQKKAARDSQTTWVDPSYIALLEAQATDAEHRFKLGLGAPVLSPCPSAITLEWNPSGHYYTVYLIGLATGMHPDRAQRVALFSQVADLVDELDATWCGFDYMREYNRYQNNPTTDVFAGMINELAVQQGLHTLTGRPAKKETQVRREIMLSAMHDDFIFGLAAHAYGDSFAHRMIDQDSLMYSWPIGHAVEWLNGRDPHCPDFIGQRPGLYADYADALWNVFGQQNKTDGARGIKKDDLIAQLYKMACTDLTEQKRIEAIRGLAQSVCHQTMSPVKPEEATETAPWTAVAAKYPVLKGLLVATAHRYALDWSNASR